MSHKAQVQRIQELLAAVRLRDRRIAELENGEVVRGLMENAKRGAETAQKRNARIAELEEQLHAVKSVDPQTEASRADRENAALWAQNRKLELKIAFLTKRISELKGEGRDSMSEEKVNHPKHYQHPSGVEAIDICEELSFNVGNALKYMMRHGKKRGEENEDLKKAAWYLRREVERGLLLASDVHKLILPTKTRKLCKQVADYEGETSLGRLARCLEVYGTPTMTLLEEIASEIEASS